MEQIVEQKSKLNTFWWVLIIIFVAAGVVANNYFTEIAWSLKLAGWVVLTCVVLAIGYQTVEGKKLVTFAKNSRIELRKVTWPTRDETVKTTMVVAALVIVMALILWMIDSLLLWIISWLTSQRG